MEPRLDWEMGNVFYPFVLKERGGYVMFCTVMGGGPHHCSVARAGSSDGLD